MQKIKLKTKEEKRKLRVRKKVEGTTQRPRLAVFRSNKYIYAQIINDQTGHTLVALSLGDIKAIHAATNKQDASYEFGKRLAQKALAAKIESVVFDRSSYKYHGRVKMLAEGAREGGLSF